MRIRNDIFFEYKERMGLENLYRALKNHFGLTISQMGILGSEFC
jgi:hypothetical protein